MPFEGQTKQMNTRSVTKIQKIWNSKNFQGNESTVTNCKWNDSKEKFKQVNRWPTNSPTIPGENESFVFRFSRELISNDKSCNWFWFLLLLGFDSVLTMLYVTSFVWHGFDWFQAKNLQVTLLPFNKLLSNSIQYTETAMLGRLHTSYQHW